MSTLVTINTNSQTIRKRIRLLLSVFLLVTSDLNSRVSKKVLTERNIWFTLHGRQGNSSADWIINAQASDAFAFLSWPFTSSLKCITRPDVIRFPVNCTELEMP